MIITRNWLRFWRNGPGVAWKSADEPMLFSQRHGYTRYLTVRGWRFTWLNSYKERQMVHVLNEECARVHELNKTWWHNPATGEPLVRNIGELLMLTVSEIAEAMEGHRKDLNDDKLPHRKMFEVELADALIRIFDIAGGLNLDLGGAYEEKLAYNAQRADHKPENRVKDGGKKY